MIKGEMKTSQNESLTFQYLAAFVVTILAICYGIICGWASPTIYAFTTAGKSPLDWSMTMDQASWIASLLAIGGITGNVFFGVLASKFGRKLPLLSLSLPMTLSWVLIYFGQINYFYAARLLHGFTCGGVMVLAPVFLLEIANDSIRGVLSSSVVVSTYVGILIAFIMGKYCNFYTTPLVTVALTILFVAMFSMFPESPTFLIKQNRLTKAEKSTRFYQNIRGRIEDSKLLQAQMDMLKGDKKSDESHESSMKWSDLMTNPGRKAMIIGITLASLNQLSGCFAMISYTATIFEAAGSATDPNTSAIIIGFVQLFGSFASIYLIDRAGRKLLFIASTAGTACGFIFLGTYMQFKEWNYDLEAFNWIPIASFGIVIFLGTMGITTLPYTVIGEVMPHALKDFGVSFCMMLLSLCSFFALKFLPLLIDTLGLHWAMFLFSGVCVAGTVFIIFEVPETKGKSHEEIMNSLMPSHKQTAS